MTKKGQRYDDADQTVDWAVPEASSFQHVSNYVS